MQSSRIGRYLMATMPVEDVPRPASESFERRLRDLETQWKTDTEFLSDARKIINHSAFKAIIALGKDVVPILLRDLETKSLWVWALPEITDEDPVPAIDGGNIRKMAEAWIKWGREKGLR